LAGLDPGDVPGFGNLAFGVDQEGRADEADEVMAEGHFGAPDAIGIDGDVAGVGDELAGDAEPVAEAAVLFDAIPGDADDHDPEPLEFGQQGGEFLVLDGAPFGVILGIEVEDD
jgi:hypothetical protein